jgi:tetratricopeptide (TPR) repeat protein
LRDLLVGLAFATIGLVMATRDRDRLQAALETATRQTRIAEAVNAFLERDLLAPADPLNTPDRQITVAELLDRTSARIEDAFPGEPLVEASIRTTLGVTYRGLGEYEAAVRHLEEALRIRRSELGDDHPMTLESMLPLAWANWYLGRYEQAEALWVEALPASRRELGEDHPDTLHAMAGLAALYNYQHRFEEALPLHLETVARSRAVLGEEHVDTLTAMHNLAWLDQQQGRTREAAGRFTRVLEMRRRVLGEEHPHTLTTLTSLAGCYRAQGRHAEAESLQASALETSRRVLGDEHPATLHRMTELAELYDAQHRHDLAEPLLVDSLARLRDLLGDDHRDTQYTVNVLAAHRLAQGRPREAERLLEDLVERQQRLFGEDSPIVRNSRGWLARARTQVAAGHEADGGRAGLMVETVESFRAAVEAGDYETARLHLSDDPRTWYGSHEGPGSPWTLGAGRWKPWDEEFNGESDLGPWNVGDGRVFAVAVENNDYYRAIERDPSPWLLTYFIDDQGRIEGRMVSSAPDGLQPTTERSPDRGEEFDRWLRERYPEEHAYLRPDGRIDPTGDRAARTRARLVEWRREIGLPPLYP